jgi:glycine dehydrogenase subunit 2
MNTEINDINRKLLMDRSTPGRIGATLPPFDVPKQPLPPDNYLRKNIDFPELSESELVRYFSKLSQFNFSIDHNFYPLGSCTMKYNPKINDEIASIKGIANLHPLQDESTVQGALKLMFELQDSLCKITGMDDISLAPMAGADGELAGMLMTKAYHLANDDPQRKKILIPDSAHGTNPASAVMA